MKVIRTLLAVALLFGIEARADNLPVTSGSGNTVGADSVVRGGITELEQVIKLSLGAENTHDGFARMGQQTMANSLACVLPSNQSAIPATITDSLGNAERALPVSSSVGLNGVATGLIGWATVTGDLAETSSTTTVINATAHSARVNDVLFFNSGTAGNIRAWSYVTAVAANTITVTPALPTTPANGDGFVILRPVPIGSSGIPSGQSGSSMFANVDSNYQVNTGTGLLKLQGGTWNASDAGVQGLFYREAALTTTGVASTDGKNSNGKTDDLGAIWQRPAPNQDVASTLVTCSGCTTTQTGSDQKNYSGKCALVVLDMTSAGTGSVTLAIEGKDIVSGKYSAILTGAAVTTNSTNLYRVCPGLTAAANAVANDFLPKTWRVKVTANNANATTYTVGASIVQ